MASKLIRAFLALALMTGVVVTALVTAGPASANPAGIYEPNILSTVSSLEDMPVPGDWDGNGHLDPAVVRNVSGAYYWYKYGQGPIAFGLAGDYPVQGDYSYALQHSAGVSMAGYVSQTQIAVYRPSNNTFYILGPTGVTYTFAWGQAGDLPMSADYIGRAQYGNLWQFAVYRPSSGELWVNIDGNAWIHGDYSGGVVGGANSRFIQYPHPDKVVSCSSGCGTPYRLIAQPSGTTAQTQYCPFGDNIYSCLHTFSYGTPGDQLAFYDYGYTGFGPMTSHSGSVSVFRPSNGTWYIRNQGNTTSVAQTIAYGVSGDYEVAGNWNGPNQGNVVLTNLAVFRPCNATWYIRGKAGAANVSAQWGQPIGGC